MRKSSIVFHAARVFPLPALAALVSWFLLAILCNCALADCYRCLPHCETGGIRVAVVGDDRGVLPWQGSHAPDSQAPNWCSLRIYAREGERYRLRISNDCAYRVGLVVAVDGRNVVSGTPSYGRSREGMYILTPFQSMEIAGWRSGMQTVQRFYFTRSSDSYAWRHGDRSQIGVIRVNAFRDRTSYNTPGIRLSEAGGGFQTPTGDVAPAQQAQKCVLPQRDHAGTGYGEGTYAPVRETDFDAESFAFQIITVNYDWPSDYDRPYPRPYPQPAPQPIDRRYQFSPPPP